PGRSGRERGAVLCARLRAVTDRRQAARARLERAQQRAGVRWLDSQDLTGVAQRAGHLEVEDPEGQAILLELVVGDQREKSAAAEHLVDALGILEHERDRRLDVGLLQEESAEQGLLLFGELLPLVVVDQILQALVNRRELLADQRRARAILLEQRRRMEESIRLVRCPEEDAVLHALVLRSLRRGVDEG